MVLTTDSGTDHKQGYWPQTRILVTDRRSGGTGHRQGYWSYEGVAVVLATDRGSSGTGQRQG